MERKIKKINITVEVSYYRDGQNIDWHLKSTGQNDVR